MADSTPTNHTPLISDSSSFLPTVSLYDWWLVKAENDFQGKRLAVAGVSSRNKGAVRVFVSAPIVKRFDVFSLETSDGIHVIISGFINEQRTLENGFAPQVFNSFLFGFPPNWETYALGCLSEETKVGTDSDNIVMDKDESVPSSDKDKDEGVPSSDNEFESEAGADPVNAFNDNDEFMPSSDNEPTGCPEIISDSKYLDGGCEEKSTPTSSVLAEEAPGKCEKPIPKHKCDVSMMSEASVAYGSGGNRSSARLLSININDSDNAVMDTDESVPTLDNEFLSKAGADPGNAFNDNDECMPSSDDEPTVCPEIISDSKYLDGGCEEKSTPTSSVLAEEALGKCEKPIPKDKCDVSKMSEASVAYGSGGNRRSGRLLSININDSDNAVMVTDESVPSLDNEFLSEAGADPGNAFNDNDECMPSSGDEPAVCPEIISDSKYLDGGCEEKSTPTSSVLLEDALEKCEKPIPKDKCNVSKMSGASVAYGSGGNRRSARLHNINVKACQQKKHPTPGISPKFLDKDQSSTSVALENFDGGLQSPSTPIQSQSKRPLNKLSEQLVRKCSSRTPRTLSAKTEGCYKKKARIVETEVVTPKRKMMKPALSVKSLQERDVNHSNKGSKQKISLVSPESLSLRKSRSGRLLLPPLEFWRNQIPIYDANHEVTEIQEGESLASSYRGSPATLHRSSNQKGKRAA